MGSWLGKFHEFTKKYDPLGHELVNGAWKSSTKLVNESSRAMQKTGDKWGINTDIPEYGKNLSQKDKNSFNRWGENTLGAAALIYGGMSAAGGAGSGSSGGTLGATGADGAFLGEGAASGIGAWDGAFAKAGASGGGGMSSMMKGGMPGMGGQGGAQQQPAPTQQQNDPVSLARAVEDLRVQETPAAFDPNKKLGEETTKESEEKKRKQRALASAMQSLQFTGGTTGSGSTAQGLSQALNGYLQGMQYKNSGGK